jgi:uroporphyrinogen-III synthase
VSAARRPLVLVTRPAADAGALADLLSARGIDTVVAPMLEIVATNGPPPDLDGVRALLLTSRNGVRAFAERVSDRTLPVYVVGPGTAREARERGFAQVASADGDAVALARFVAARRRPDDGALLHVVGADKAGDLARALGDAGFSVRTHVAYAARAASSLPSGAEAALMGERLAAVAFFSPRTARTFASVVVRAGLADRCRGRVAACISPAVAEAVRTLPWSDVRVSARPDQAALVDLLVAITDPPMSQRHGAPNDPVPDPADGQGTPSPASVVVERFGGIRPTAAKLEVPVTTVQGWKKRGYIPLARHADIRAAALRLGVALSDAELAAATPPDDGAAAEDPATMAEAPTVPVVVVAAAPEPAPPAGAAASQAVSAAEPTRAADATAEPPPLPPSEPPPQPAAPPPPRRSAVPALAFGVALLALAVAIAAPFVLAPPAPQAQAPARDLEQRLARIEQTAQRPAQAGAPAEAVTALEGRLAALETRPAPAAPAPDPAIERRLEELTRALQALAPRLQSLEQETQAARARIEALARVEQQMQRLDGALGAATARLDRIDEEAKARDAVMSRAIEENAGPGAESQALVLAVGQLRAALDAGRPFATELDAARGLAADRPEIGTVLADLAPVAARGVPDRVVLADRFRPLPEAVIRADRAAAEGGTWVDQALGRLGTLVTVRRVGEEGGNDVAGIVARAEARMGRGDVVGAVAALEGLTGAARQAAGPWLADATARVRAEGAVERATAAAIGHLTAGR